MKVTPRFGRETGYRVSRVREQGAFAVVPIRPGETPIRESSTIPASVSTRSIRGMVKSSRARRTSRSREDAMVRAFQA
jgi:hypothetical protein